MTRCDRKACNNILRRQLIYGCYICKDCYDELCDYKDTWKLPITQPEMKIKIEKFMDSEKGNFKIANTQEELNNLFNNITVAHYNQIYSDSE